MGSLVMFRAVLVADVAINGTFTVPYPSGYSQATLTGSIGGMLTIINNEPFYQGIGVAFSFDASVITIQNTSTIVWPKGSYLRIGCGVTNRKGSNNLVLGTEFGTATPGTGGGSSNGPLAASILANGVVAASLAAQLLAATVLGSGSVSATLGGASKSLNASIVGAGTVLAALAGGVVLGSVFPSGSLATGVPSSGTLLNATPGSTITSSMSGLTINSAARTYTWDGTPAAGTQGNINETPSGGGTTKSNPTGCVNKNFIVWLGSSDVAGQKVSAYGADPSGPNYPSTTGSWSQLVMSALQAIDASWVERNRSISGTGAASSVSRFDTDVKPYYPSHCFIGTHCKNDGYDSSVYTPNTVTLIAKCRALGIIPIVRGGYPSDGPTNANYQDELNFNIFLDTLGVHRIDHMSTMDDGTGNILLSSTYSPDNLHMNNLGHQVRFSAVDLGIFTGGATSTAPITYSTAAWSVTNTGSTQLGTKLTPQRALKSGTWRIRNKAPGNNAMCPLAIYGPTNPSQPLLRIRNSAAVWAMAVNDNSQEVSSTFDATSSTASADIIVTYNALNKAAKFYLNGALVGGYTLTTSDDISDFTFGGRKETTGNPYVLPTNTCEAWLVPLSAAEIARLYSKSTTHPGSKILQGNQSAAPGASGSNLPNDIPNGILPVLNTAWQVATAF